MRVTVTMADYIAGVALHWYFVDTVIMIMLYNRELEYYILIHCL